jgi:poly(hydroxyalkanoate) depolymerase family esterase
MMHHRFPHLVLTPMAAFVAGCAATGSSPVPAGEPTVVWREHASEAGSARYRLVLPSGPGPAGGAPLLVLLHGCTQDPEDFARGTRFDAAAARAVLVYPEQPTGRHPQRCWSWYDPASPEPALIAAIAREVMDLHPVDPARVYIVGISAGAAMALNVVAADPALFAAAAVHSGVPLGAAASVPEALAAMRGEGAAAPSLVAVATAVLAARGRAPLPLIALHGADDAVVNAANGRAVAAQWATAAGAKDFVRRRGEAGGLAFEHDVWGPLAELWMVAGLGHAWSGGDPGGSYTDPRGPDATGEILRFLLAHRLP